MQQWSNVHRHTGLEVLVGWTKICPTQSTSRGPGGTSRGVQRHPQEILKNKVFIAISCVFEWVFMHRASDE